MPAGCELDDWRGRTFMSVVGVQFVDTRVLGVPIPFHRHVEEVNPRFYVRRRAERASRRGGVFSKELVPRLGIAFVARVASLYGPEFANAVAGGPSTAFVADGSPIAVGWGRRL